MNLHKSLRPKDKYQFAVIVRRFTCYALTPEGSLLIETPQNVIYSNERYYVYKENDEYHISEIEKTVVSKGGAGA